MTMRLRLTAAMLLGLLAQPALAEDAKGDWTGALVVTPTASLRLAVHIQAGPNGTLTGTLDSLDQNARGIPLADIRATPDTLAFTVPAVNGSYAGTWDEAKKAWVGQWSQGGRALALSLARGETPPALPPPSPLPADWTIPSDAAIAAIIDDRIAGRPGEGIVIGIVDANGRRIVAGGPNGAPALDARTLFEIGSLTKVFTATILADMAARGEVRLDDPVAKYLPAGTRIPERGGRRITLLDLATHRSGLPRLSANMPLGDLANPYADYTETMMFDFLAGHELTRDIGSQFEYSNLGFGLLGHALARRAGTDFATLVADRILKPLGMDDTSIALSPGQRARFATPHDEYMRPTSPWDLPALPGAGALRSTADDMLNFLSAQIGLAATPLSPAMQVAVDRKGQAPATGLSWFLSQPSGRIIPWHGGGTGGFRTAMAYDPVKKRGVVVLTNAAVEPAADDIAMHLLLGAPISPNRPVPPAPAPVPARTAVALPVAELDRIVGRYALRPNLTMEVVRRGVGVVAGMVGSPALPIFPEAPLRFFWRTVNAVATFTADADGKVTGVTVVQDGQTYTGRRLD